MRRLIAFIQLTVNGYFAGGDGDIGWAHHDTQDAEWNAFVADNVAGEALLLFGRVTYELMVSYWPTPMAAANDPLVARYMNSLPKAVFSRSLERVDWHNTQLIKTDLVSWVREQKQLPGKDMCILGSGSLIVQLAQAGLIDEFQVSVNPVVLGGGRTIFEGLTHPVPLKLTRSRNFANGNVLLCYQPAH
ncbi:dihydrofolate reductase family protein [Silvimonas iriomotensis]|uniref:Bacterial bifunctional deaminase-reductase C-terminal domain-containing protein n=1 Tax=Silvimonas iriomotensis TaxID=449662 RepID=A0ABQ2PAC3_9NEIS|nr:dihydrofolate reductase family protein [Silvimonas iriomotensis]GGP22184.1 hypothetical protein GCM10010970_23970 [Silvimonas iriomotensis]